MEQNLNKKKKTIKVPGPVWNIGVGVYVTPDKSENLVENIKKYWFITVFIN